MARLHDYYPFGMQMAGRNFESEDYRFGFNGKEKDNSFGGSSVYDYGFRIYNPSIAKFLSVDPLTKSYPMLTPYQFASNYPIAAIDLDGLEAKITITAKYWENAIKQAADDDINRAVSIALEAIFIKYSNLESETAIKWAEGAGGWQNGKPAYAETNKDKFPAGITVVNSEGELLAWIKKEEHWYDPVLDLFNETGGGYKFYTSSDLNGQPIGEVRIGASQESIDINLLMTVIGGAKASADVPKNYAEQFGKLVDAFNIAGTLGDELGIEEKTDSYFEATYCTICHKTYKPDSSGFFHETSERATSTRNGHGHKEPFKKE
ncbi:hypothetical protein PZB74_03250 [Porifericola rhodea]|nr:RHS repeat-associated core domain-containing protein [Porifericola rhodea]WKN33905.1 hypothetical protein PZB74_03250 [Porifericola rhodea]